MTATTLQKHFPELSSRQAARLAEYAYDGAPHEVVDEALELADEYLGGCGVEAIDDNEWAGYYLSIGLLYVNRGDTYTKTLMYDTRTGRFVAGAWGDYIDSSRDRRRRFGQ